jgi:cyclopropane fatty-acyl-phospholipid synthase-like methyltransferase
MGTVFSKENIKIFYNKEAEIRNGKSVKPDWKANIRENILSLLKKENKRTLLELGAGAGHDSKFFMDEGLSVIAIDFSSEMVKKCIEKNIEAYELDLYNLSSLNRKFDCIYSINTIQYIPKSDLPKVFEEINLVLNKNGLFYMGLYGGKDAEKEMVFSDVPDIPLFFAFHSEDYLKLMIEEYFEIICFENIHINNHIRGFETFYSYVLRKT